MKNKKVTYILLPLVALIWGLIFYKIYQQITEKEDGNASGIVLPDSRQNAYVPDTFKLLLNYRDPFQSYSFHQQIRKVESSALRRESSNSPEQKKEFVWPNIRYSGMIVNQQNKAKTGLLNFNSQSLLVKEGEVTQGYKVVKLYGDSVIIGFNKLRKTFMR